MLRLGVSGAADFQAYELSMALSAARARQAQLSGLTVDWSKCYDRVALSLIPWLGSRLKLPRRMVAPLLDMYSAPRRVLLDGIVSHQVEPLAGITAGCPLAGDWLALIAYMLVARLRAQPTVAPRPYVDDLIGLVDGGEQGADWGCAAGARTVRVLSRKQKQVKS